MAGFPNSAGPGPAAAAAAEALLCVACHGALEFHFEVRDHTPAGRWYPFHRCIECGALRIDDGRDGDPSVDEAELYVDDESGATARFHQAVQRYLLEPEIALVLAAVRGRRAPRVLEVGCGGGLLGAVVRSRRPDVVYLGIEPRQEAAAVASRAGIEIVGESLRDASRTGGGLDAVVLVHVLEHVDDPCETVSYLATLLAPGGAMVVSVPAADSLEARIFGHRWYALFPPHHRWIPTRDSLLRLLSPAGLEFERMTSWSWRTPLIGMVASLLPALEPARLRQRARTQPVLTLLGQAALAVGMVAAVPFVAAANASGRGASLALIARRRTPR